MNFVAIWNRCWCNFEPLVSPHNSPVFPSDFHAMWWSMASSSPCARNHENEKCQVHPLSSGHLICDYRYLSLLVCISNYYA